MSLPYLFSPGTVLTPSGREIVLSSEEESEVAKEALKESFRDRVRAKEQRINTLISSSLNAVGWAGGVVLASVVLGLVLKWTRARRMLLKIPSM